MRREVRTVVWLCVLIFAAILRSDNTSLARRFRHGEIRLHSNGEGVAALLGNLANAGEIDGITVSIGKHKRHVAARCRPVFGSNRRRFRRAGISPLRTIPRVVVVPHHHVERIRALGSSRVAMRARGAAALVVHERRIQLVVQRIGSRIFLLAKRDGVVHIHIQPIGRSSHGHLVGARFVVHQIMLEVRGNAIRRGGVLVRVLRLIFITKRVVKMRVHACLNRCTGISVDAGRALWRANNKIEALTLGLLAGLLLGNRQAVERFLIRIGLYAVVVVADLRASNTG